MADSIDQNGLCKLNSRSVHYTENPPEFKCNLNPSPFGVRGSMNRESVYLKRLLLVSLTFLKQ